MPLHRLLIAILAMVMALSLAACNSDSDSGGGSSTEPEATSTPTAAATAITYKAADFAGEWQNFQATHEDYTHVGTMTLDGNGNAVFISMPTVPKEAILGHLDVTSLGAVTGELSILFTFNDGGEWWSEGSVTGGFRDKTHLHLNLGRERLLELNK